MGKRWIARILLTSLWLGAAAGCQLEVKNQAGNSSQSLGTSQSQTISESQAASDSQAGPGVDPAALMALRKKADLKNKGRDLRHEWSVEGTGPLESGLIEKQQNFDETGRPSSAQGKDYVGADMETPQKIWFLKDKTLVVKEDDKFVSRQIEDTRFMHFSYHVEDLADMVNYGQAVKEGDGYFLRLNTQSSDVINEFLNAIGYRLEGIATTGSLAADITFNQDVLPTNITYRYQEKDQPVIHTGVLKVTWQEAFDITLPEGAEAVTEEAGQ